MIKKNIYIILFLLIAFIMLYISRTEYGSFSLDKSMKACKINKNKNNEDIKIFCEKEINKTLSK